MNLYLFYVIRKQMRWWLQNYIIGVPTILCGFRDDNGFVKKLEYFNVADLPSSCSVSTKTKICNTKYHIQSSLDNLDTSGHAQSVQIIECPHYRKYVFPMLKHGKTHTLCIHMLYK